MSESLNLLPESEMSFQFIQSSGPGGQNVNKVATAVQLRFNLVKTTALNEETKARLLRLAGKRVTDEGVIVIEARRYRSQEANRLDAIARLNHLVEKALQPPSVRKPTRPGAAAKRARMAGKKKRAEIKQYRRKVAPEPE
jgi:ribosome-associated protein